MAKNKVVYNGQTLIDLTDTTATAADVASGKYFYTNAGVRTQGTASGGAPTVATATKSPSSSSSSISFTVSGEPIMFSIHLSKDGSYLSGSSTHYVTSATNDGNTVYFCSLYLSNKTGREYCYNSGSWSYSNGTLTIDTGSSSNGQFKSGETYRLVYVY